MDNEFGGKYVNGIIVYLIIIGVIMLVMVEIIVVYKGYMEFRFCLNDDLRKWILEECLNNFLLIVIELKSI